MNTRAVSAARLALALQLLSGAALAQPASPSPAPPHYTAVRAGKLIDPATGTVTTDQIILIKDRKFEAIGPKVAIPSGAEVIDLTGLTVLPGLVDAHNHLAITYKVMPERNNYYVTVISDSTPLRGDPGRVQRHPDARRGFHHRPRHGEQRPLRGHRAPAGHRGGVDPRPADHQRGHHHRQRRRPVLAHAGDGHREEGHLPRVHRGGYPRRAGQGGTAEHAVRREGHQDLRRLQALGLLGGRHQAGGRRGREGRPEGGGPRADRGRCTPGDRGRRLVHRPRPRARRREPQADGEAGHLPRRNRDSPLPHRPPDREGLQARRGRVSGTPGRTR